jgi:flagellar biosynthesis/type III secretory pathway chaperone
MSAAIDTLMKILDEELQLHSSLLESAAAMNAAIKAGDVAGVQRLSSRYDQMLGRVEQAEERRLSQCDAIAAEHDLAGRHLNVSRIIDLLTDTETKNRLIALRAALKQKVGELAEINCSNRILLEEGLRTVAKTFEMATKAGSPPAGYEKKGRKDTRTVSRSIINQLA